MTDSEINSAPAETTEALSARLDALSAQLLSLSEVVGEIHALVKRAAPLLDSPAARMAASPAGAVLSALRGGRRG